MITKPSLFDIKYDKMTQEESLLNYNRDMMLWEQTEALNKLSNGNNTSTNTLYNDYVSHYTPINRFDVDTPEHNKYERFSINYDNLLSQDFYLKNNLMGFLFAVIICIIVAIPICICVNSDLAKTLGFVAIPITLISALLVNLKIKATRLKINNIVNKLEELDDLADKMNTPKRYSRKITKKPQPEKEILILDHKNRE